MSNINKIFQHLTSGNNLSIGDAKYLFELIIDFRIDPIVISSLLTLLKIKNESFEEIYSAVEILKDRTKKIKLGSNLIDTCGTGGDNKGSFNFSTATAILASACDLKVAKHGNRSITSKSGSSDILESLGINLNISEKQQKKFFEQNGISFLFAPLHHPSLKKMSNIRKLLPFKTIFNLVGPLLNPATLDYQLLGVGEKDNLKTHSKCLLNSKIKCAWVVYNSDGYDELTTTSPNLIYKIEDSKISKLITISPEQAGLNYSKQSDLLGGNSKENAYMMHRLFEGETGAIRDNVLLNTSACLVIAKKVKDLKEGVLLAAKKIDDYSAKKKLEQLINSSMSL